MVRSRPAAPPSSSSGRPIASARPLSRPATVTESAWSMPRLWLDQSEIAVGAAEQHVDLFGRRIAEHEEGVAAVADLDRGFLDRHRLHGVAARRG